MAEMVRSHDALRWEGNVVNPSIAFVEDASAIVPHAFRCRFSRFRQWGTLRAQSSQARTSRKARYYRASDLLYPTRLPPRLIEKVPEAFQVPSNASPLLDRAYKAFPQ